MSVRQTDGNNSAEGFLLTERRAETGAALFAWVGLFIVLAFLNAPAAQAVTVGPAKLEYQANPGDIIRGNIFIMNDGAEERTFYATFEKFTEVNGEKKFIPGETTGLVSWIKMPREVTLAAGEQKEVPFTIEVPQNAPPGGHFAVIWWGTAAPGVKQVSIVTRAGALVYLRVSGDVKEAGELLSFRALDGRITARLPDFEVRFKNAGNTYLKPQGKVVVKNIFGGAIAGFKVNDVGRIILPGNEEPLRLSPQFDKRPFAFGVYHADLNLAWGEKPETLEKRYYILVLPWLHILGGIVVLLLLYFGAKVGLRKYNERIIAKYASADKKSRDKKNNNE